MSTPLSFINVDISHFSIHVYKKTGDFNAMIGSGHTTHPAIVGKYGKGQANSNGELLLDIAQRYNLTIANTLF